MFLSPEEAARKAIVIANKHNCYEIRVSGCEAILGETSTEHFCQFVDELTKQAKPARVKPTIMLETNGIMLGYNPALLKRIAEVENMPIVRICLKGDSPENFELITGARKEAFQYQINVVKQLKQIKIGWEVGYMETFSDPEKIKAATGLDSIEPERLKVYGGTKENLMKRDVWKLKRH